jgi:AcrR family transcriptional regulator
MQRATNDESQPRRPPRTRAAQEIVDAILVAAAEILAEGGYRAMTTNHLAERAGVSIGSLYRYFPNKESIIAELGARLEAQSAKLLEARRASVRSATKEEVIRTLGTTLTSDELGSAATRRALLLDVPRRWIEAAARAREARVHALLTELLHEREQVREGDHALMAFVIEHAVRGIIEGAIMYRPELFESAALAEEVARLISRYTEAREKR